MSAVHLTPVELGDIGHVQITTLHREGVFVVEVWDLPGDAREGYSPWGTGRASTIEEALELALQDYRETKIREGA